MQAMPTEPEVRLISSAAITCARAAQARSDAEPPPDDDGQAWLGGSVGAEAGDAPP
jgi:hypothetical protein